MRRAGTAFRGRHCAGGGIAALTLLALPAAGEPAGQAQPFTITNLGPGIIAAVTLSAAGQGRFGPSLIGRVELPPGQSLHLTPPRGTACLNDLRIRWADGRTEERAGEDLCQPHRVLRIASPPP